jgi:hypothetical protein
VHFRKYDAIKNFVLSFIHNCNSIKVRRSIYRENISKYIAVKPIRTGKNQELKVILTHNILSAFLNYDVVTFLSFSHKRERKKVEECFIHTDNKCRKTFFFYLVVINKDISTHNKNSPNGRNK